MASEGRSRARMQAGRVITGSAAGCRLLAPGSGTRPLGDRAKQAMFAALDAAFDGTWSEPFLDLFAGSGAGGIEALSRGAPSALFVERDTHAAQVVRDNLARCRLQGGVVVRDDVLRLLEGPPPGARRPFRAALVDPPYGDGTMTAALERLSDPATGWMQEGGIIVAKHHWRDAVPEQVGSARLLRQRRVGETVLSFYQIGGGARDQIGDDARSSEIEA